LAVVRRLRAGVQSPTARSAASAYWS